jgi:competence ComEA-like helix-hairpin-helix protein
MWKDFFYYSKSERRAVYVLLVLIALFVVGIVCIPERQPALDSGLTAADSAEWKKLETETFPKTKYSPKDSFPKRKKYSETYRSNSRKSQRNDSTEQKDFLPKKEYVKVFKYPEGTQIDVNSADTIELKKIPGIGSGIAGSIVRYRERLGGFYALNQLEEVKHVTPDLLKWFKLENDSVRKVEINKAGLDKLRAHPYLNFYQAKIIIEHRRTKGAIKSLSQLALYEEFAEKDLNRLSAYISFD